MKLIIDIPNEVYDWHVNGFPDEEDAVRLLDIVKKGTPLSESEDCISRQAVLDLAKFDGRENLGSIIHAFDVEQLPPVTTAEKVGRWINHKCSGCGYGVMPWNDTPYCPNCGEKKHEVEE